MKRSVVCLAMLLLLMSSVASAGESISDVANWTPSMYANAVSPQGWKELSDTDQYRLWTTSVPIKKPQLGIVVSLKTAEKGVDGSITNISIVSVNAVCGASGTPPNYVQMGMSESFDEHGPISGDAGGPTVRLVPDTNLAVAVQRACKTVRAPIAEAEPPSPSKPCSTPNADYPIQAIRQGHQGIVYVMLTVGANERPTDVRVYKSSGFPELDASAVQAMTNVVCNDAPGTHVGMPVTFSLH